VVSVTDPYGRILGFLYRYTWIYLEKIRITILHRAFVFKQNTGVPENLSEDKERSARKAVELSAISVSNI
jgi:hypothetical protein